MVTALVALVSTPSPRYGLASLATVQLSRAELVRRSIELPLVELLLWHCMGLAPTERSHDKQVLSAVIRGHLGRPWRHRSRRWYERLSSSNPYSHPFSACRI